MPHEVYNYLATVCACYPSWHQRTSNWRLFSCNKFIVMQFIALISHMICHKNVAITLVLLSLSHTTQLPLVRMFVSNSQSECGVWFPWSLTPQDCLHYLSVVYMFGHVEWKGMHIISNQKRTHSCHSYTFKDLYIKRCEIEFCSSLQWH